MSDDFQFDGDELAELRVIFFEQAREVLDSLGELILNVERDPADAESLRAIRRAVHTLKGDSTAFGYGELTELAHHYEDALDRVRAKEGAVASRGLIDLLLAGADALAALVQFYRGECPMPETAQLIAGLDALRESEGEKAAPGTTVPHPADAPQATPSSAEAPESAATPAPAKEETTLSPAPAAAPTGEASATSAGSPAAEERRQEDEQRREEDRRSGTDRRQGGDRRQQSQATTLRVESDRIDAAMNLVGELII
ncbi:MAG: Hpt domain-containing protein, partial [Pyrinomonadaceae bacterium]